MKRLFAYLFVSFTGLAAIGLSIAFVWGVNVGKLADFKSVSAPLLFIVWWSWAAISVYVKFIKQPRDELKQLLCDAEWNLPGILEIDSDLSTAVKTLKSRFSLIGEPRYRDSIDPTFDTLVQLETRAFIISLYAKSGTLKLWKIG